MWVPPLLFALSRSLDPRHNPFFQHAEMRLYLAWRGGEPVGRIAATVNRLHNEYHQDKMGFWGYFESANDPAVARALLDRAAADLRQHGLTEMIGPMNPSINGEIGVLVEGFDRPPVVLMPYNPPYYEGLILQAGLQKAKELYAYLLVTSRITQDQAAMERLERLCDAIRRRHPALRIRSLDMGRLEEEVLTLGRLFNSVRRSNWGFVPMTDAELVAMANEMKRVVDAEMIVIAEVEGQPVGCMLNLPDINPILKRIDGRLFPFGWARLLWGRKSLHVLRVFGAAATEEYRRLGPIPLLFLEMIRRGERRGYVCAELSWVAEGNLAAVQTFENALHPQLYKRYRVYQRSL